MPEAHDRHVDVQVLEEVERILATTSFATIDDLAGRLGGGDDSAPRTTAPAVRHTTAVLEPALTSGESSAPLPRRR